MLDSAEQPAGGDSGPQRWRSYHALALLPTVGMPGGVRFANRS